MGYASRTVLLLAIFVMALAITMGVATGIVKVANKMQQFTECVQARQAGLDCDTRTSR